MPENTKETQIQEESRWYILHTYSGHEDKVSENLKQRIENLDLSKTIHEVLVPSEVKIEIKDGERQEVNRKMYAGYLLVKMIMTDDSWFAVRNTPGVTGFVSAEDESDNRPKPVPLEQHEVDNILNQIDSEEPRVRVGFAQGETVRITDGPFVDFVGAVDEVYPDRAKVKVLVSFFGRETPVELDFLQVEKA